LARIVDRHGPADVATAFRTRQRHHAILFPANTHLGHPNRIRAFRDTPQEDGPQDVPGRQITANAYGTAAIETVEIVKNGRLRGQQDS